MKLGNDEKKTKILCENETKANETKSNGIKLKIDECESEKESVREMMREKPFLWRKIYWKINKSQPEKGISRLEIDGRTDEIINMRER